MLSTSVHADAGTNYDGALIVLCMMLRPADTMPLRTSVITGSCILAMRVLCRLAERHVCTLRSTNALQTPCGYQLAKADNNVGRAVAATATGVQRSFNAYASIAC